MTERSVLEREVLSLIRPTDLEIGEMHKIADNIISLVRESGKADAMMVGSVARRTCVRGDRDLDVFMLFSPTLTKEELKQEGLALAHKIAEGLTTKIREKYAEHPYVNATISNDIIGDLDLDLVPCFKVDDAAKIQSAVDRTPFHTRFISGRIPEFTDDVLLLKQFVKSGGVYGSDQMTEGFAGYLCELLILHYGGFNNLINAGANWKEKIVIDIMNHGQKTFDDPMVVIDPVDPYRNVSASVSVTKFHEFIELCRGYIDSPSKWFFNRPPLKIYDRHEFADIVTKRDSFFIAITIESPDKVKDIIVPQLRRSLNGICELLERNEFTVIRADTEMLESHSILLFELTSMILPSIKRHVGPPVTATVNASKFVDKYLNDPSILSGPYIMDNRYVVEVPRMFQNAKDLLVSPEIFKASHGTHIKSIMKEGYEVFCNQDCMQEGFEEFISQFLQKASPLVKIRRAERNEVI